MADDRLIEIMADVLHELKSMNGKIDVMQNDIHEMKLDIRKLNMGDSELRLSVMKLSEEVKVIPELVHRIEALEKRKAS